MVDTLARPRPPGLTVGPSYGGFVNTRARRLIVSGLLGGLLLLVVVVSAWHKLR